MAREFARAFYRSKRWQRCRAAYISHRQAIDGGLCESCRRDLGYIVHHVVWLTPDNIDDPTITLSFDNLEYVCLICHNKIEEEGEQPRYRFDESGMPIPIDAGEMGAPP